MLNRGYKSRVNGSFFLMRYFPMLALCAVGFIVTTTSAMGDPEVSGEVVDVSVRIRPADHSLLPNVREIGEVRVDLMEKDSSLYAASDAPDGSVSKNLRVKQLRGYKLSASATDVVQQAVVARVNEMGIGSVAVLFTTPEPGETGRATINVVAGTLAKVNVKSMDESEDEPESAQIVAKHSPIQVGGKEPALLEVEELNEYLAQLNRFPGRSVTASISAGENPGTLLLDYLIDEKTFNIYTQVSNTGTESTSEWIERFGVFTTQLSGNDDMLSVEGVTGSFKHTTRSVIAYYDSRFGDVDNLRYRVTGSWGDYTAADVGFLRQDFTGSTWAAQFDLIYNFYQDGNFFLDLDAGVRYWNSHTKSEWFGFVLSEGECDFITPTLSITAFDIQPNSSFQATLGGDYTSADADQSQLNQLGRINTDEEWWTMFASFQYSFYIDSLFDESVESATVKPNVNEITLRAQGQYAFDDRLTPLAMSTMGGYYTVRGYPQSVTSGDSAVCGSVEYRYHLPRSFDSQPAGTGWLGDSFRWARDADTGAGPEWDLALLGFLDGASLWQSDPTSFEDRTTTLLGAGVGLELSIRNNLKATVNYGWALKDLESDDVQSGEGRVYFLGSLTF